MAHAPASRTLVCYRCPCARDLAGGGPPTREEKRCKAVWPAGLSIAPAVELCGLDSEKLVCRGFQPSEVLTSHAGTKGEGKRQDAPVTTVWEPRVISCSSSGVHLRRPCDLLFVNMCLSFPICDLDQEGKVAIPTSQGCCGDRSAAPSEGPRSSALSVQAPSCGRTRLSSALPPGALLPGARSGFVSNKMVFDGE